MLCNMSALCLNVSVNKVERMNEEPIIYDRFSCNKCADKGSLDFDFTMAFQPIINCLNIFSDLNIRPLAEGVETQGEMRWLRDAGIELMQGYLFASPGFECLPAVDFSQIN